MVMNRGALTVLVIMLLFTVASKAFAEDWSFYAKNPSRHGNTTDTGPKKGIVWWSANLSGAVDISAPIAADGKVFIGTYENMSVFAFDANTGSQLWRLQTLGIIRNTPSYENGFVYITSADLVYALNASTGETLWNKTISVGELEQTSSPTPYNGVLYFGSGQDRIFALNAKDGSTVWEKATPSKVRNHPVLGDGRLYIHAQLNTTYALNANTGAQIWNFTLPDVANGMYDKGTFYYGQAGFFYAVNGTTGAQKWNSTIVSTNFGSPTISKGVIYVATDPDARVYALRQNNGVQLWNWSNLPNQIDSAIAISGDGVLYFGSSDKKIYALNVSTGVEIWNLTTLNGIYSSGAVWNGALYIASDDGKLYAIKDGTNSPPAGVSDLNETSVTHTTINWQWENPNDLDFNHTEVYLNNVFKMSTQGNTYNPAGLKQNTTYTISTVTVDVYGNRNTTPYINDTVITDNAPSLNSAAPSSPLNRSEDADNVTFTITKSDADADSMTTAWYVNGSLQSETSDSFTYIINCCQSDGVYEINATITDGILSNSTTWRLEIINVSDFDKDNISDAEDDDDDGDTVNDVNDTLYGNETHVATKNINGTLNLTVNGSSDFSQQFNESLQAKFLDSSGLLVEFMWDFQNNTLYMPNVSIEKNTNASFGSITVKGVNLTGQDGRKTVYVDRLSNSTDVCILDKENATVSEVSGNCTNADETKITCTATTASAGQYNCTLTGLQFKVEGLNHTTLRQIGVCIDKDKDSYGLGCIKGGDCNDTDASKSTSCPPPPPSTNGTSPPPTNTTNTTKNPPPAKPNKFGPSGPSYGGACRLTPQRVYVCNGKPAESPKLPSWRNSGWRRLMRGRF